MAQGRKPNPPTAEALTPINETAVAHANEALNVVGSRSREIAERFGDGAPYDRTHSINRTKYWLNQGAQAMFEVGKELVQMKENEPYGEFQTLCESEFGIAPRTARRFMQTAVRFTDPKLGKERPTLAVLGSSKLFELMAMDDEDIIELSEGGTVVGLQLDDVQRMSVHELRTKLKEARQSLEAKERLIEAKNKKLDEIEEAANKRGSLPEQEQQELQRLQEECLSADMALHRLAVTVEELSNSGASTLVCEDALRTADHIAQRLVDVFAQRGIPLDVLNATLPEWKERFDHVVEQAKAEQQAAKAAKKAQR